MTGSVCETVETLLEGVLEVTEDEDARFKLRTALQLVVVAEDEHARLAESLAEADLDEDLEADLRDLGYLE